MVEEVYESLVNEWDPASTLAVEPEPFMEPQVVTWGTYIKRREGSH